MSSAYFAQADLENALGIPVVKAIFDDNQDGDADGAPIAACIAASSAECDSFLRGTYAVTFPISPVPDELKYAAVDFGCAYATRRRPDLVQAMGEKPWTSFREAAIEKMKAYASGLERLPATTATPANVGGVVVEDTARIASDSGDF